jgi:hypothetical protein
MRSSLLPIAALVGAVVISACGSSGSGNGSSSSGSGGSSSGASSSGSSGGSSSSGSSGGSSSTSSGGQPGDGGPVDGDVLMNDSGGGGPAYTVQFGPINVPPNTENTQCIIVNLHNPSPLHVGQIHDLLGTASHHMILYKVAAQAEMTTPFPCQPFQSALNPAMGNPLIISQKMDDTLTLPPGVAFTLDANQTVRLEMHYINANPNPAGVTLVTTSTLTPVDPASYKWDASFLFVGDPSISIPPMAMFSTGQQYFTLPSNFNSSNFFAITGHEHHLGTNVQIWSASSASDPGTQIYQSTSWSDPPVTTFSPPIRVTAGGGFKFQCDWVNNTTSTVSFGESANNEMCFFWAYYWPSQGAQVCFVSQGLNACCPGPNPICSQL